VSAPHRLAERAIDPRPARSCYKCGREIAPDETICEVCNRAGMATPSATQYHGTVAVAIVIAVALLAGAASLAMRGIGPYSASTIRIQPDGQGSVLASVAVTNKGSKPGRAKCELRALDAGGRELAIADAVTPVVAAGASVTIEQRISGVDGAPSSVAASCQ
jgi:uncharacterized OB-fold protein